MSFLKIEDHNKRDETVKEFLALKNKIKDNFRKERLGEIETQRDLAKLFKPVTETQKAAAKEITGELKPIKEGIENLPKTITFPTFPSIEVSKEKEAFVEPYILGDIARNYLGKYTTKGEADTTFGIYDKDHRLYMGNKPVIVKENNIVLEDEEYEGTPGLWELIVSKKPKDFSAEDYDNYAKLIVKSNALYRNYTPDNPRPKSNRSYKWKNILSETWDNRKHYTGSGLTAIPSDPNALLERLDLLLATQDAGHTGVGNELTSICDELKRQGVINVDAYKKINSLIKI